MEVFFQASTDPKKKLMAIFYKDGKKIKTQHFGSKANKDFTIYSKESKEKAAVEKKKYIARHKVRENFNAPMTAGALSKHILWNKPTREASIRDYVRRFKMKRLRNPK